MTENQLSKILVDTCYRIHVELGPGLFESVYEEIAGTASIYVFKLNSGIMRAGKGVLRIRLPCNFVTGLSQVVVRMS